MTNHNISKYFTKVLLVQFFHHQSVSVGKYTYRWEFYFSSKELVLFWIGSMIRWYFVMIISDQLFHGWTVSRYQCIVVYWCQIIVIRFGRLSLTFNARIWITSMFKFYNFKYWCKPGLYYVYTTIVGTYYWLR